MCLCLSKNGNYYLCCLAADLFVAPFGMDPHYSLPLSSVVQISQEPILRYMGDLPVASNRTDNDAGYQFKGVKIPEYNGDVLDVDDSVQSWRELCLVRGRTIECLVNVLDKHLHDLRGILHHGQVRTCYYMDFDMT